jgi:hypothetical protein
MSVAGISSIMTSSPYLQGPQSNPSAGGTRQSEDDAARALIVDLQKGDLADAQKAYNTLASFGPNNSGPWAAGSQMQSEFQQLGQDLASGNVKGAQSDVKTLASNQLASDRNAIQQSSGNATSYTQALQNYQGDYWAIFGTMPQSQAPVAGGSPTSGINVIA